MKKLLFVAMLGVAGLMSAANEPVEAVKPVTTAPDTSKKVILEDEGSCQWCVSEGGNMYCAEASTCTEARKTAREMAISDQP